MQALIVIVVGLLFLAWWAFTGYPWAWVIGLVIIAIGVVYAVIGLTGGTWRRPRP